VLAYSGRLESMLALASPPWVAVRFTRHRCGCLVRALVDFRRQKLLAQRRDSGTSPILAVLKEMTCHCGFVERDRPRDLRLYAKIDSVSVAPAWLEGGGDRGLRRLCRPEAELHHMARVARRPDQFHPHYRYVRYDTADAELTLAPEAKPRKTSPP
jgi:hypothetical protein